MFSLSFLRIEGISILEFNYMTVLSVFSSFEDEKIRL